jgi:hypothetical protein
MQWIVDLGMLWTIFTTNDASISTFFKENTYNLPMYSRNEHFGNNSAKLEMKNHSEFYNENQNWQILGQNMSKLSSFS